MIIRSHDKTRLILNGMLLCAEPRSLSFGPIWEINLTGVHGDLRQHSTFGQYKSLEDAVKVLDELENEALNGSRFYHFP